MIRPLALARTWQWRNKSPAPVMCCWRISSLAEGWEGGQRSGSRLVLLPALVPQLLVPVLHHSHGLPCPGVLPKGASVDFGWRVQWAFANVLTLLGGQKAVFCFPCCSLTYFPMPSWALGQDGWSWASHSTGALPGHQGCAASYSQPRYKLPFPL